MTGATVDFVQGEATRVRAAERLGSGSQGHVHAVAGDPRRALKLYRDPGLREARLMEMLEIDASTWWDGHRRHQWLGWPDGLVRSTDGKLVGYTMARLDDGAVKLGFAYGRATRQAVGLDVTSRWMLRAAVHLATAAWWGSARGIATPDLNDTNVLLQRRRALATILDADGMVPADRIAGPLTEAIMPPEALRLLVEGGDSPAAVPVQSVAAARWALAIACVRLLLDGDDPWAGYPVDLAAGTAASTTQNILAGSCRLLEPSRFRVPPGTVPLEALPPNAQALARRCFSAGVQTPSERPSAEEWARSLAEDDAALQPCRRSARHAYNAAQGDCPWCELAAAGRGDPFAPLAGRGGAT